MKNKIKKIIPLILCFVMVFANCMIADAKVITLNPLEVGSSYDFSYESHNNDGSFFTIEGDYYIESASDNVYMVPALVDCGNNKKTFIVSLVSKGFFKYILNSSCEYKNPDEDNVRTYSSSGNGKLQESAYQSVNNNKVYFTVISTGLTGNRVSSIFDNIDGSAPYMSVDYDSYTKYSSRPDISTACLFFENDFQFDDGKAFEYDLQPSVDILPPSNVSYFEAERPAEQDYYFQLEWDNDNSQDLNVEIAIDIKYKSNYLSFNENVIRCLWMDYYNYLMSSDGKISGYVRDLSMNMLDSYDIKYSEAHVTIDSFYIRFARENSSTGQLEYSLWTKLYLNRNDKWYEPLINSSNGNTGYFDSEGNWIEQSVVNGGFVDGSEDVPIISPGLDMDGNNASPGYPNNFNPNNWDSDFSNVFDSFKNAIKSSFSFIGEFPAMLSEFFGFLPASVIGCISIGLIMVVVLRFLGR